jgi:predicted PolB exonuclease-like 3'-5' exonuclease
MAANKIRYLVFDVESATDGQLVSSVRYPDEQLDAQAALRKYREERIEATGSTFIPHTYQFPISIVVGKVDTNFKLTNVVALDEPRFRSHVMTEHFWRGWQRYGRPTLVSFNGRGFDIPLLELAAFRYGIGVPTWFDSGTRVWSQPRNRYNTASHLDLQDALINFGATRFSGGLNLAAQLLGKPGKLDVRGDMVQELYEDGQLDEINQYCRCDVLDTYFVFLRYLVLVGSLTRDDEEQRVAHCKAWLLERAEEVPAFATYLDHWADWPNPWKTDEHRQDPAKDETGRESAEAETSVAASADVATAEGSPADETPS